MRPKTVPERQRHEIKERLQCTSRLYLVTSGSHISGHPNWQGGYSVAPTLTSKVLRTTSLVAL